MHILLHNASLVDPGLGKVSRGSVLIDDATIKNVGNFDFSNNENTVSIDCHGHYIAPGLVDIGVKIGEPGERYKESFRTAGLAAARGGVTTMATRPDTVPSIDMPETLEFFVRRATAATPIKVRPIATLTKSRKGNEMTEVRLLLDAGAVAFSDCDAFVTDAYVMQNCMLYCRQHDALVIGHPQDPWLSRNASATSGKFALLKGLSTVSQIAEKIGLERDIALVSATLCKYHADQITTSLALTSLRHAMDTELDITAGVSVHHLTLNELDIDDYRTFFKVKPPLRSENDRNAVVEAVSDGTISIISSMHTPQDEESKRLPFEEAASGAVGLETLLPASLRLYHSGEIDLPTLFRALSFNPAKRLGLDCGRLAIGAPADLVLFDPDFPFVLDRFQLQSKSKNTPFDGHRMQGVVLRTFVNGREVYNRGNDQCQN